ncbi:hypothetical protein [Staphylococcus warneri]|uniref:hypothetical protein n=1 Tax=Staphylococcus warneri TaxID=1292 RepID=UPI0021CFE31F|nr:hypothetical protein [Staphylococcus warneri]
MTNLSAKESFISGTIKGKLNKHDAKKWKNLSDDTKRELIELYKTDKYAFDYRLKNYLQDESKFVEENEKHLSDESRDHLIKFFATQGIYNPSETTLKAFSKQSILASFDKFYSLMGMFTLNTEKQALYNYYMTQQKQNFIQIAQNDKLIKQNDEIIDLLKQISNKGEI